MNYFNNIFTLLKSWQVWNMYMKQAQNVEKKIFVRLTVDRYTHQFVTQAIETPRENVEIRDILLPMRVSPLMLNVHRPSYPIRSLQQFVRKAVQAERAKCVVTSFGVNTFDDVAIELLITTCYSVLAEDCRSTEPKFAVLMKKVTKGSEEKVKHVSVIATVVKYFELLLKYLRK
uniref:PPIase cyclophilin-type domain-containing protein n=1 Tax=Parascaris univalens TaxID=6257 RepID=A0A915BSV4_PARUN